MTANMDDPDPKSKRQKSSDRRVGYGSPPEETRWVKGQSGNPNGSSKKRRRTKSSSSGSVSDVIFADSNRIIKVREGDRVVELTMRDALTRNLGVLGLKGSRIASTSYLDRAERAEKERAQKELDWYQQLTEYVDITLPKFEECEKAGQPPPDIVPHPEDIKFDHRTRTARIEGALTRDEKRQLEKCKDLRDALLEVIREYQESSDIAPWRPSEISHIETLTAMAERLNSVLPERLRKLLPPTKKKTTTGSRKRFDLS